MSSTLKRHRHRFLENLRTDAHGPVQYILHGNTSDLYLYGGLRGFLDLKETLTAHFSDAGFDVVCHYGRLRGLEYASPEMRGLVEGNIETGDTSLLGGSTSSTEARPISMPPEQAFAQFTEMLSQSEHRTAVIIDHFSLICSHPPSEEMRELMDHVLSWADPRNGNVSVLLVDGDRLDNLDPLITGRHRSGVRTISIGFPDAFEVSHVIWDRASVLEQPLLPDNEQFSEIVGRLTSQHCRDVIQLCERCRTTPDFERRLTLRTVSQLMEARDDPWSTALVEDQLPDLERALRERVLGQDHVVSQVIDSFRGVIQARQAQQNTGRVDEAPLQFFFLAGPTGVGKTELYRALHDFFHVHGIATRKINMTEYMERHAVSRFFGAGPGYVGHGKGELGSFLHATPACIILFDEFEKAHEDVWKSYLTMLEGGLTTGDGERLFLGDSILFFTSNAGADRMRRLRENSTDYERDELHQHNKQVVLESLKERARMPEFIGRIKESVLCFDHLTSQAAASIIDAKLRSLRRELTAAGRQEVSFHESIRQRILDDHEAGDWRYGGRSIRDAVLGTMRHQVLRQLPQFASGQPVLASAAPDGTTQLSPLDAPPPETYVRRTTDARASERPPLQPRGDHRALAAEVRKALVMLLVEKPDTDGHHVGTAFFVSDRGHVLTNRHVVSGASRVWAYRDGGGGLRQEALEPRFPEDPELDLAVLTIEGVRGDYLALARPDTVIEQGEHCFTLGFPLPPEFDGEGRLREGHPLSKYDEARVAVVSTSSDTLELSAPLNHGNSGGPLIAIPGGEVIGVVFAKRASMEGAACAVSLQRTRHFLEELGLP
ncbi:MAG: AAA family ATPase [Acidobacteriota bacterium]